MKKKLSLSAKVFIGFGVGIVIGLIFGEKALILKPVGDLFLRLIKPSEFAQNLYVLEGHRRIAFSRQIEQALQIAPFVCFPNRVRNRR